MNEASVRTLCIAVQILQNCALVSGKSTMRQKRYKLLTITSLAATPESSVRREQGIIRLRTGVKSQREETHHTYPL